MRLSSLLPCLSLLSAACVTTGPAPREIASSYVGPAATAASSSDPARFETAAEPVSATGALRRMEMQEKKKKEPWINIFVFGSSRELDEVTFENDDTDFETDADNVETTRFGAGVAFGKRNVRGYVNGFIETLEGTFDAAAPDLDADGIGFGGGVMGEPAIAHMGEALDLILPYHLDLALVVATDDDIAAGEDVDLVYYDTRLEAGLGIDWNGLQPSVGVRIDTLVGGLEFEDDLASDMFDATFTGFNVGGYAGLKYKHPDFPLWFDVSGAFGDVQGVTGTLGFEL